MKIINLGSIDLPSPDGKKLKSDYKVLNQKQIEPIINIPKKSVVNVEELCAELSTTKMSGIFDKSIFNRFDKSKINIISDFDCAEKLPKIPRKMVLNNSLGKSKYQSLCPTRKSQT